MRLVLFGHEIRRLAWPTPSPRQGFEVERPPRVEAPARATVAALAAYLRGGEPALAGQPAAAAVVCGGGDDALAAALAAVKLRRPDAPGCARPMPRSRST